MSIHWQVYLQKQFLLCLTDSTPLLSTLDQWSEIARWLACFCYCNEAKPRPEVSAVRFPNTLCMLKLLPPWNVPITSPLPPPTFNHTHPFLPKLSSLFECTKALHLAFHPSFLLPSQLLFFPLSPQRSSPSFGLPVCSREDWDSSWLWVPERGRESITPIRHSAWNCKVTVETAVFCQGQRCPCLEISHTESPLSLSS